MSLKAPPSGKYVANFSEFRGSCAVKKYILVIKGSVPPFVVVVRRKHSPNLSLPALSAVIQTDRYSKILQTERREVG